MPIDDADSWQHPFEDSHFTGLHQKVIRHSLSRKAIRCAAPPNDQWFLDIGPRALQRQAESQIMVFQIPQRRVEATNFLQNMPSNSNCLIEQHKTLQQNFGYVRPNSLVLRRP